MQNTELLRLQLNHLVTQARHDIYSLSSLVDESVKRQLLQRLWDAISTIHFLSELLANQAITNYQFSSSQQTTPLHAGFIPPITPLPNQSFPQPNNRIFTIEELGSNNGKNGRPAYVAVNGIVYDVTNNRAWAAATHFGLTSGKVYTQEFASCHAGQQSILTTLPVVGRLA
jgi:membrane-associated progesterone receptor component